MGSFGKDKASKPTLLLFESISSFRKYSQPCGFGFHLVVFLLSAVAAVESHRRQNRTAGSNAGLENEIPYSSQEKSKGVDLLDSALESEKYIVD